MKYVVPRTGQENEHFLVICRFSVSCVCLGFGVTCFSLSPSKYLSFSTILLSWWNSLQLKTHCFILILQHQCLEEKCQTANEPAWHLTRWTLSLSRGAPRFEHLESHSSEA